MPKKELKSNLGGFDMKSYLRQEPASENISNNQKEELLPAQQEAPKENLNQNHSVYIAPKPPPAKTKRESEKAEDKIAFLNYMPPDLYASFSYLLIEARMDIRQKTKKALAQTELVEAIVRHTIKTWNEQKSEILLTAEEIVGNRKTQE